MRASRAIREFVEDLKLGRKSPNTLRGRENDLQMFLSTLTHDNIASVTTEAVRRAALRWDEQGLSQATLHRRQSSLRCFVRWGLRRRYWTDDPMDGIPLIDRPDCLPKPMTREECEKLMALALPGDQDLMRALLMFTGVRVTGLCTLTFGAVTLDPPMVRVRLKGGREQEIPMHPALADKVAAHLLAHPQAKPYEPLLSYRNGKPVGRSTVGRWCQAWGEEAGVPHCHPHRFRHSYGTELLEQTSDLRIVQEALGHQSITSTVIYTRVRNERLRAAIGKLPWGRRC